MSGQYITTVSARFPHRMAAAASLYGVGIVTDKEDLPHLLLDKIKGELYYAFAEHDQSVPAEVMPALKDALARTDVKHTREGVPRHASRLLLPGAPAYNTLAAEQTWSDIVAMWDRHLK